MSDESEDYLVHAESLKDQGNDAFKAGKSEDAVEFYSQAIALHPDGHVYYSNRSAAYMKLDSISKALKDGEKCVSLKPDWPKGYNRLGVAQQRLKRFDAAMNTFKKGLECCNDTDTAQRDTFRDLLQKCEEAHEKDKQRRFEIAEQERKVEEERIRKQDELKESMRKKEEEKKDEPDDLLAGFFSEVTKEVEAKQPKRKIIVEQEKEEEKNEVQEEEVDDNAFHEKYLNQDLGTSKAQHERLTARNYEWHNLNPFAVLQLDTDATEQDIKNRYRKLSAKVHPDKNRGIENADVSFQEVKKAYNRLLDKDQRKVTIKNIEVAKDTAIQARADLIASRKNTPGFDESILVPVEEEIEKAIKKVFADIELARRNAEKNIRSHSMREKEAEAAEEKKMAELIEKDREFNDTDKREKRIGNWRDFQQVGKKRAKTNKLQFVATEKREK